MSNSAAKLLTRLLTSNKRKKNVVIFIYHNDNGIQIQYARNTDKTPNRMWLVEIFLSTAVFFLPLICIRFNLDRTFYFVLSPAYLPLPCILPIISAVLAFVDVWVVSFARVQFIVRE